MKKYLSMISIIIALLMLSACGTGTPKDNDVDSPPSTEDEAKGNESNEKNETQDTDSNQEGKSEYYIDLDLIPEDAYDIFKSEHPNAKVKRVELDKDDGSYVYEVEGFAGNMEYEVKIDPFDGKIIKAKEEYDDDREPKDEIKKEDLAKLPALLKEAVEDVKEGYQLKDWDIEVDDGIVELEIEFIGNGNKIEYKYNLRSGELIRVKGK